MTFRPKSCFLASLIIGILAFTGPLSNRARADIFYVSNQTSAKVQMYDGNGTFLGTFANGPTTTEAITFDSAGNAYVLGASANVVEKYSPTGTDLGVYASLGLNSPIAAAFDSSGNLFVSNFFNNGSVIKFGPGGSPATVFGTAGTNGHGLAFDSSGNVFVSDFGGNRIMKFTSAGVPSVFATTSKPTGLAFDSQGNLYAANSQGNTITKFSAAGANLGVFASTNISSPDGLAFDSSGNLYVANAGGNTITRYSSAGAYLGVFTSSNLSMPVWITIQVPEPASISVLGLGVAGLMFRRRHFRG